jgi:P2-related tail formation protein
MSTEATQREERTYTPSGLLQYLPAVYAEDPFLGQFLLAFEKILLGRDDSPSPDSSAGAVGGESGAKSGDGPAASAPDPDLNPKGLEQIIDGLATLYDPANTPEEFLPWLSKWTALSLRADMTLEQQRKFVEQVIQLYQYRGTQENLLKLLELFLTAAPTIVVDDTEPYFFHVVIKLPRMSQEFTRRQFEIAQALVEQEKPAHTDYELKLDTPTLQIGTYSTVGVDTLLGTAEEDSAQANNPPAK